jgi:hypothetical protein
VHEYCVTDWFEFCTVQYELTTQYNIFRILEPNYIILKPKKKTKKKKKIDTEWLILLIIMFFFSITFIKYINIVVSGMEFTR